MSINLAQLHDLTARLLMKVEPAFASRAAIELVLGTAAQESALGTYIRQKMGPALGICQMEPRTYLDIWHHFIDSKPDLRQRLEDLGIVKSYASLEWDLRQDIVMCRLHYRRIPEPLPASGDWAGQARYWKLYYNTPLGAGTEEQYLTNLRRYGIAS